MISENLEIEFKTLVTKKQLKRLLSYFPKVPFVKQTNYYFSSKNSNKIFRIREIDNTFLFTFKSEVGEHHQEFEKKVTSLDLNDPELEKLLNENGISKPYTCLGKLTTNRAQVSLYNEANLCFDMNTYDHKKDFEIEYEVSGSLGSLDRFKALLDIADIKYIPNKKSKTSRALSSR